MAVISGGYTYDGYKTYLVVLEGDHHLSDAGGVHPPVGGRVVLEVAHTQKPRVVALGRLRRGG